MSEKGGIQTAAAFANASIQVSEALLHLISSMARSYYDNRMAQRFANELDRRMEDARGSGENINSFCGFFKYEKEEDAFKAQERLYYNGVPSSVIEMNGQPYVVVLEDQAELSNNILNVNVQYTDEDRAKFEANQKLYDTVDYRMENESRADDFEKSLIYSHVLYQRDGLKFTFTKDFETEQKLEEITNKASERITDRCGILGEIKDQKSVYAGVIRKDILEKAADKRADFYVIDASSPTKVIHVSAAGFEKMEIGNLKAEQDDKILKSADGLGISLGINGVEGVYSRGVSQGDETKFQQTLSTELQRFNKPIIVSKDIIEKIDKEHENSFDAAARFESQFNKVTEKHDFSKNFALVDKTNPDRLIMVTGQTLTIVANNQSTSFDLSTPAGRRTGQNKCERTLKQIQRSGRADFIESAEDTLAIKAKIDNRTKTLDDIDKKIKMGQSLTIVSMSDPSKVVCFSKDETTVYIGDRRYSIQKQQGKEKAYAESVKREISQMKNVAYKDGSFGSDLRHDVVVERRKGGGNISRERYEQILCDKYKFERPSRTVLDDKIQTTTALKISQYSQESKLFAIYHAAKDRGLKQAQVVEMEKVERLCANFYDEIRADRTRRLEYEKDSVYKAENVRVFVSKNNPEQSFIDFFRDNIRNREVEYAKSTLTDFKRIEELPDDLQRFAEEYFNELKEYESDPFKQQSTDRDFGGRDFGEDINPFDQDRDGVDDAAEIEAEDDLVLED